MDVGTVELVAHAVEAVAAVAASVLAWGARRFFSLWHERNEERHAEHTKASERLTGAVEKLTAIAGEHRTDIALLKHTVERIEAKCDAAPSNVRHG